MLRAVSVAEVERVGSQDNVADPADPGQRRLEVGVARRAYLQGRVIGPGLIGLEADGNRAALARGEHLRLAVAGVGPERSRIGAGYLDLVDLDCRGAGVLNHDRPRLVTLVDRDQTEVRAVRR